MMKAYYIHVWKCHKEAHYFVQLIYASEKVIKDHGGKYKCIIHHA
jgi:hypothetical protein